MSSGLTATVPVPTRSRLVPENSVVVLRGVTWQEYRTYRDEPSNDGVRMYYSDGTLLLMTTGQLHERISALLGLMLHHWTVDAEQAVMTCGRWTLQRQLKQKGLEADDCYYISHLPDVEGKQDVSLERDPPPDLAIEVDITTRSQHKLGIYAALGVPEVWVWMEDRIAVYRLTDDGAYAGTDRSQELAGFPLDVAAEILLAHSARNDMFVMKAFREALTET